MTLAREASEAAALSAAADDGTVVADEFVKLEKQLKTLIGEYQQLKSYQALHDAERASVGSPDVQEFKQLHEQNATLRARIDVLEAREAAYRMQLQKHLEQLQALMRDAADEVVTAAPAALQRKSTAGKPASLSEIKTAAQPDTVEAASLAADDSSMEAEEELVVEDFPMDAMDAADEDPAAADEEPVAAVNAEAEQPLTPALSAQRDETEQAAVQTTDDVKPVEPAAAEHGGDVAMTAEEEAAAAAKKWDDTTYSHFFSQEHIAQAEKRAQANVDSWLDFAADEKADSAEVKEKAKSVKTNEQFLAELEDEVP